MDYSTRTSSCLQCNCRTFELPRQIDHHRLRLGTHKKATCPPIDPVDRKRPPHDAHGPRLGRRQKPWQARLHVVTPVSTCAIRHQREQARWGLNYSNGDKAFTKQTQKQPLTLTVLVAEDHDSLRLVHHCHVIVLEHHGEVERRLVVMFHGFGVVVRRPSLNGEGIPRPAALGATGMDAFARKEKAYVRRVIRVVHESDDGGSQR